jgi:hypothetical protein
LFWAAAEPLNIVSKPDENFPPPGACKTDIVFLSEFHNRFKAAPEHRRNVFVCV